MNEQTLLFPELEEEKLHLVIGGIYTEKNPDERDPQAPYVSMNRTISSPKAVMMVISKRVLRSILKSFTSESIENEKNSYICRTPRI